MKRLNSAEQHTPIPAVRPCSLGMTVYSVDMTIYRSRTIAGMSRPGDFEFKHDVGRPRWAHPTLFVLFISRQNNENCDPGRDGRNCEYSDRTTCNAHGTVDWQGSK